MQTQNKPVSLQTTLDITVVIPTFNGADKLPRVFDALRAQVTDPGLRWEVIVADNNSTDATPDVVDRARDNWPDRVTLHYIPAPTQGAAYARQAGVEAANSEIIAFLDDDNLPEPDWIQNVFAFAQEHPQVGAFGSQTYAIPPLPPSLKGLGTYIAVIDRQHGLYKPENKIVPPTAGLAVRKQAWLHTVPEDLFLNFAGSDSEVASEDMEAMFYMQRGGWEIWHNSAMKMGHLIPPERLERRNLLKTVRRIGLSSHHLRRIRYTPWKRPFLTIAHGLKDRVDMFRHKLEHGEATPQDLCDACKRVDLENTLKSPFHIWRIERQRKREKRQRDNLNL